jgi:dGTPase
VAKDIPGLDARLTRLEAVRRMIGEMIGDVLDETRRRAEASGVDSADEVRALGHALVAFSPAMAEDLARLRAFLHERMYRHWRVNRSRSQARRILADMFALFLAEPEVLPAEWYGRLQDLDEPGRARVICDYIAGMTDRYAIEEHRRLFQLDIWAG